MKNVLISLSLFIIMIFSINFSISYLNKKCEDFKERTIKLEQYVKDEDIDKAYTESVKFLDDWKKTSKIITVIVNHNQLDSINSEVLKLTQYIKYKDLTNAQASIHTIRFDIDEIMDLEKINIQNLL